MAVFQDPLARIFPDEWHSLGERREISIGHLRDRRLVLVVFCETSEDWIRMASIVGPAAIGPIPVGRAVRTFGRDDLASR